MKSIRILRNSDNSEQFRAIQSLRALEMESQSENANPSESGLKSEQSGFNASKCLHRLGKVAAMLHALSNKLTHQEEAASYVLSCLILCILLVKDLILGCPVRSIWFSARNRFLLLLDFAHFCTL